MINFYQSTSIREIIQLEDRKGRLKASDFSKQTLRISDELKDKRNKSRKLSAKEREYLLLEIEELRNNLESSKNIDFEAVCQLIVSDKQILAFRCVEIKGKISYCAEDLVTRIVCQLIKEDLKHAYRLTPANRDDIVEQVFALLDSPMRQLVIRADINSFFESIPQVDLLKKIEEDGYVSSRTIKCLKRIFYRFNEDFHNNKQLGIPRGLAFSSYLSEIYLGMVDAKIKDIEGVYFYRRYVDDLILVANPSKFNTLWGELQQQFAVKRLTLHEDSIKRYIGVWGKKVGNESFDYLGYHWTYLYGCLKLSIKDTKVEKYKQLIAELFDAYSKSSHFRTEKRKTDGIDVEIDTKQPDSLILLFRRLKALTGNGLLTYKKSYVATGIYFSNKYINEFAALDELDEYLHQKIVSLVFPPRLFEYKRAGESREENIRKIKEKLHQYSFRRGFEHIKIQRHASYSQSLVSVKRIHLKDILHG